MTLSIRDFKQKYPIYKDIPDRELAEELHQKYYSHEPKESFLKDVGATGYKRIASDVVEGVKRVPSAIYGMAKELPVQLYESGKQVITDPKRAGQNILSGLGSGGSGLLNAPANIIDYLRDEAQVVPDWLQGTHTENQNYDYRKGVGLLDQKKGDELLFGLSQFAPNVAPGAMNPAAAMALQAIGQKENPVTAALIPGTIKGVGKAVPKAVKSIKNTDLTPSGIIAKYTKNNLSLSELAERMRASEGTNTPLGDVLKSPRLKKKFENELAVEADWEVENTYRKINDQIQKKTNELINERLGSNAPDGDPNSFIKGLLEKAYKDNRTIKNNLYNSVNEAAKSEGLNLNLSEFENFAKENAKAISESPLLKSNADFRRQFNLLSGLQETTEPVSSAIVSTSGKPLISKINSPSIRDANIISNDLYDTGRQMLKSPNAIDRQQGNLYLTLSKKLKNGIESSIEENGSPELKKQHLIAKNFYKDEFVQFLDNDLYKLLEEGKDPQTIVREIIKPGAENDKSSLIRKVQEILPDNQKNLLGYSYLRTALNKENVLQPSKVKSLIKVLGNRQFIDLFPDIEIRKALIDFTKLHDMNTEAASFLANPKTGARNVKALNKFRKFLVEAGVGGAAGAAAMGTLGGFLGIPVAILTKNLTNKYLAKILTEQGFREKVAKKIKERQ